jgi:hypothetical protein
LFIFVFDFVCYSVLALTAVEIFFSGNDYFLLNKKRSFEKKLERMAGLASE